MKGKINIFSFKFTIVMNVYQYILNTAEEKGAAYFVLLDPDKLRGKKTGEFLALCENAGVDAFLVGGSLLFSPDFSEYLKNLKSMTRLPVIIFPGGVNQVSPNAHAILYLSIISGRNAEHLIGKHVLAAPLIKQAGIEPISTGYMIIESGSKTTAEYISGSIPIPRNKPEIAAATGLAAQYMGMKLLYLEAGSGAEKYVPFEMVEKVASFCNIPVVVGGGIRTPETAGRMVKSGAKIIVTGNFFEDEKNWDKVKSFSDAVHYKLSKNV